MGCGASKLPCSGPHAVVNPCPVQRSAPSRPAARLFVEFTPSADGLQSPLPVLKPAVLTVGPAQSVREAFQRLLELLHQQLPHDFPNVLEVYSLELQGTTLCSLDDVQGGDKGEVSKDVDDTLLDKLGDAASGTRTVLTARVREAVGGPYVTVSLQSDTGEPITTKVRLDLPLLNAPGATIADLVSVAVKIAGGRYTVIEEDAEVRALLSIPHLDGKALLCPTDPLTTALCPGDAVLLEGVTCSGAFRQEVGTVSGTPAPMRPSSQPSSASSRPPSLKPLSHVLAEKSEMLPEPSGPFRSGQFHLPPIRSAPSPNTLLEKGFPSNFGNGRRLPPLVPQEVQSLTAAATVLAALSTAAVPAAATESSVKPPATTVQLTPDPADVQAPRVTRTATDPATAPAISLTPSSTEPASEMPSVSMPLASVAGLGQAPGPPPAQPAPLSAQETIPVSTPEPARARAPEPAPVLPQEQVAALALKPTPAPVQISAATCNPVPEQLLASKSESPPASNLEAELDPKLHPEPLLQLGLRLPADQVPAVTHIEAVDSRSGAGGPLPPATATTAVDESFLPATAARAAQRMRELALGSLPAPLQPKRPCGQGSDARLAHLLAYAVQAVTTGQGNRQGMQLAKVAGAHAGQVEACVGVMAALEASGLPPFRELVVSHPHELLQAVAAVGNGGFVSRTSLGRGLLQHLMLAATQPLRQLLPAATVHLAPDSRSHLVVPSVIGGQLRRHGVATSSPCLQEYVDNFAAKGWAQYKKDDLPTPVIMDVLKEVVAGAAVRLERVAAWLGLPALELLLTACSAWDGSGMGICWYKRISLLMQPDVGHPAPGACPPVLSLGSKQSDSLQNVSFPPAHRLHAGKLQVARVYVRLEGLQQMLALLRVPTVLPHLSAGASAGPAPRRAAGTSAKAQSGGNGGRVASAPPAKLAMRLAQVDLALGRVLQAFTALAAVPPEELVLLRTQVPGTLSALARFLSNSAGQMGSPLALWVLDAGCGSDAAVLVVQLATEAKWRGGWPEKQLYPGGTVVVVGPLSSNTDGTHPPAASTSASGKGSGGSEQDRSDTVRDVLVHMMDKAEKCTAPEKQAAALHALAAVIRAASPKGGRDGPAQLQGPLAGHYPLADVLQPNQLGRLLCLATDCVTPASAAVHEATGPATAIPALAAAANTGTTGSGGNSSCCAPLLEPAPCRAHLLAALKPVLLDTLDKEPDVALELMMTCVRRAAAPALEVLLELGYLEHLAAPGPWGKRMACKGDDPLCPSCIEEDEGVWDSDAEKKAMQDRAKEEAALWEAEQQEAKGPQSPLSWAEAAQGALLAACVLEQSHDCLAALLARGALPDSRTTGWWMLSGIVSAAAGGPRSGVPAAGPAASREGRLPEHGLILPFATCGPVLPNRRTDSPPVNSAAQVRALHIAADMGDERSATLLLHAGASMHLCCFGCQVLTAKGRVAPRGGRGGHGDGGSDNEQNASNDAAGPAPELLSALDLAELHGTSGLVRRMREAAPLAGAALAPLRFVRLQLGSVLLCSTVRVLRLAGAGLRSNDVADLCSALQVSPALKTLKHLDLRFNELATPRAATGSSPSATVDEHGLVALSCLLRAERAALRELHLLGPAWQTPSVLATPAAAGLVVALLGPLCGVTQLDSLALTRGSGSSAEGEEDGGQISAGSVILIGTTVHNIPRSSALKLLRSCNAGTQLLGVDTSSSTAGGSKEQEHLRLSRVGEVRKAFCRSDKLYDVPALVSSWRPQNWHLATESLHGPLGSQLVASWLGSESPPTAVNVLLPLQPQSWAPNAGGESGSIGVSTASTPEGDLAALLGTNCRLQHMTLVLLPSSKALHGGGKDTVPDGNAVAVPHNGLMPAIGSSSSSGGMGTLATSVTRCEEAVAFIKKLAAAIRGSAGGGTSHSLETFNLLLDMPGLSPPQELSLHSALQDLWAALQVMTWLTHVNGTPISAAGVATPLVRWLPALLLETELPVSTVVAEIEDGTAPVGAKKGGAGGTALMLVGGSPNSEEAAEGAVALPETTASFAHVHLHDLGAVNELLLAALLPVGMLPGVSFSVRGPEGWNNGDGEGSVKSSMAPTMQINAQLLEGRWVLAAALRHHALRCNREGWDSSRLRIEVSSGSSSNSSSNDSGNGSSNSSSNRMDDEVQAGASIAPVIQTLELLGCLLPRHSPQLTHLDLSFLDCVSDKVLPALHAMLRQLHLTHPALRWVCGVERYGVVLASHATRSPVPPSATPPTWARPPSAAVARVISSRGCGATEPPPAAAPSEVMAVWDLAGANADGAADWLRHQVELGWRLPGRECSLRRLTLQHGSSGLALLHGLQNQLQALEELRVCGMSYGEWPISCGLVRNDLLLLARLLPTMPQLVSLLVEFQTPTGMVEEYVAGLRNNKYLSRTYVLKQLLVGLNAVAVMAVRHPNLKTLNGVELELYRGNSSSSSSGSIPAAMRVNGSASPHELALRIAVLLSAPASVTAAVRRLCVSYPSPQHQWVSLNASVAAVQLKPAFTHDDCCTGAAISLAAVAAALQEAAAASAPFSRGACVEAQDGSEERGKSKQHGEIADQQQANVCLHQSSLGWTDYAVAPLLRCGLVQLVELQLLGVPARETEGCLTELADVLPSMVQLRCLEVQCESHCAAAFDSCMLLAEACGAHPALAVVNGVALHTGDAAVGSQSCSSGTANEVAVVAVESGDGRELNTCMQVVLLLQRATQPTCPALSFKLVMSDSSNHRDASLLLESLSRHIMRQVLALAAALPPKACSDLEIALASGEVALALHGTVMLARNNAGSSCSTDPASSALHISALSAMVVKLTVKKGNAPLLRALRALSWLLAPAVAPKGVLQELYVLCSSTYRPSWQPRNAGTGTAKGDRWNSKMDGVSRRRLEALVACENESSKASKLLEGLVLRLLRDRGLRKVRLTEPLSGILDVLCSDACAGSVEARPDGLTRRLLAAAVETSDPCRGAASLHGLPLELLRSGRVRGVYMDGVLAPKNGASLQDTCTFTLLVAPTDAGNTDSSEAAEENEAVVHVTDGQLAAVVALALLPPAAFANVRLGSGAPRLFILKQLIRLSPVLVSTGALHLKSSARAPRPSEQLQLCSLSMGTCPVPVTSGVFRQLLVLLQRHCWPHDDSLQTVEVIMAAPEEGASGADDDFRDFAVALLHCPNLRELSYKFAQKYSSSDYFGLLPSSAKDAARFDRLARELMQMALPPIDVLRSYGSWQGIDLRPFLGDSGDEASSEGVTAPLTALKYDKSKLLISWDAPVSAVDTGDRVLSYQSSARNAVLVLALLRAMPRTFRWQQQYGSNNEQALLVAWRVRDLLQSTPSSAPVPEHLELSFPQPAHQCAALLQSLKARPGCQSTLRELGMALTRCDTDEVEWLGAVRSTVLELASTFGSLTELNFDFRDQYSQVLKSLAEKPGKARTRESEDAFMARLFSSIRAEALRQDTFHGLPVQLTATGAFSRIELSRCNVKLFSAATMEPAAIGGGSAAGGAATAEESAAASSGSATSCASYVVTPLGPLVLLALLPALPPALVVGGDCGFPVHWLFWRLRQLCAASSSESAAYVAATGGKGHESCSAPADVRGAGLTLLELSVGQTGDEEELQLAALLRAATGLESLKLTFQMYSYRPIDESPPTHEKLAAAVLQAPALRELYLLGYVGSEDPMPLTSFKELVTMGLEVDEFGALKALAKALSVPQELLTRPPQEVLAYVRELRDGQAFSYRCKLMLVGPGGSGKTTLVMRLAHDEFRPDIAPTDGLGVHEWALPLTVDALRDAGADVPAGGLGTDDKMTFSLWDFGGQDVYYSTHAFFMAKRAVYLILYRSRDDGELDKLTDFLGRIQALAPGSPMVLVGTHALEATDKDGGVYVPRRPKQSLFKAFPSLHKEAMFISNKTGAGVDALRQVVLRMALQQPGTGERLPASFLKLRQQVRLAEQSIGAGREPLMPLPQYEALAAEVGVSDPSQLRLFTSLLCDFGDLLHFASVPGLDDAVVLRPQWIAEVMAHVVTMNSRKLQQLGGGRVDRNALLQLMREVSPTRAEALVSLMQCFSLLHAIDENEVLVPPILPEASAAHGSELLYEEADKCHADERAGWHWWHAQYAYSYLPDALLCRTMCRLFALSEVAVLEAWRFGAVLRRHGHLVLLTRGSAKLGEFDTLKLTVTGPAPENLGARVSEILKGLLAEAFPGVKLEDIQYGCPHCSSCHAKRLGIFSLKALKAEGASAEGAKNAGGKVKCGTCGKETDLATMALLDSQAHPWHAVFAPPPLPHAAAMAVSQQGAAASMSSARTKPPLVPAGANVNNPQMKRLASSREAANERALLSTPQLPPPPNESRTIEMVLETIFVIYERMMSVSAQLGSVQASLATKIDGTAAKLSSQLGDVKSSLEGAMHETHEDMVRRVLALHRTVVEQDAKPMPALHVVLPKQGGGVWWDLKGYVKAQFTLHLLCEEPSGPHITDHPGYEIERPKEWLRKHAGALRLLSHGLGMALAAGAKSITGASDLGLGRLGEMVDTHVLDEPLKDFNKMNELLTSIQEEEQRLKGGKAGQALPPPPPKDKAAMAAWMAQHQMDVAGCHEMRREIELIIQSKDNKSWGNLQPVRPLSGGMLWLCKCHAAQHDTFKL